MHLHACQCHQLEWNMRNKTQTHTKIKLKMSTIFQAKEHFIAKLDRVRVRLRALVIRLTLSLSIYSLENHKWNKIFSCIVHDKKDDSKIKGEGDAKWKWTFAVVKRQAGFLLISFAFPNWWWTSLRAENALAPPFPALRSPTPSNVILASFLCRLIICLSCPVAERVEMTQDGAVSAVICPNCIRQRRGRKTAGGGGFGRVCSFVIGSFVAKNLEILLTYKYVRVCLVSSVYASTWVSKWVCGWVCLCVCVCGVQVLPS